MRLIDADKLIEEFVNSKGGSKSLLDSILLTGITAVVENQRTIEPVIHAHWINIKDKLPEIEKPVLVCTNENGCYIVQREPAMWGGDKYDWFYIRDGMKSIYLDIQDIAYWMPLPEPPEVKL